MAILNPTLAAATTLAVTMLLLAHYRQSEVFIRISKISASAGFVILAMVRFNPSNPIDKLLLAALLCGALGDLLLLGRRTFDLGLGAFLIGHLCFGMAFHQLLPWTAWSLGAAGLLLVVATIMITWLWPFLGRRRIPVLAYVAAISIMAWGGLSATAAGRLPWFAGLAAVLFLASDITVARQKFVHEALLNRLVGLPLYYSAQVLFAFTIGQ